MPTAAELEAIVEDALDAVGDEAGWRAGLTRLRRCFGASAAAYIAHDVATGRGRWCVSDGFDPGLSRLYADRWAAQNPWLVDPTRYRSGQVTTSEALVPSHVLVRTAFYADYLRPLGCFHRLAGTVLRAGQRIVYLTLHRPPGRPDFTSEDVRALEWLLPRLGRALALHRELLRRCTGTEAFRALFDQVPHALFLLDSALRPVTVNAAGLALTEEGSSLRLAGGRLAAERPDDDEALRRAVRAALVAEGGEVGARELAISRADRLRPVLLRLSRLGPRDGFADAPDDLVLVLAIDPEGPAAEPALLAARLWRLTPAEARLCCLLARGLRPGEAARALGVSPHTVHTQLRQIFAKSGVNRQAELLRLLERLAPAARRGRGDPVPT